jgi:energy-coupling factor transport system substrate-specific component
MSEKTKNNLMVRHLITIGIFNALIIAIFMLMGFTIGLIPIVLIFIPALLAIPAGIIFMLMIAKAPMRGIFVLSGAILGLVFLTMAPAGVMGISIFLGGVLAEILFGLMGRNKFISAATAFACYMLGFAFGEHFPFTFMKDAYLSQQASKGAEQLAITQKCIDLINPQMLVTICVITVVMAYLSSLWGKKLLHKHFEKAGIV